MKTPKVSMRTYAKSVLTGRAFDFNVWDHPVALMAAMKEVFTEQELCSPMMISQTPFPAPKVPKVPGKRNLRDYASNPLPPSPDLRAWGPAPQRSDMIILGSIPLNSYSTTDNGTPRVYDSKYGYYLGVYRFPGTSNGSQWLTPTFPEIYLIYRRYYQLAVGEVVQVGTPSVSDSYQVTTGLDATASLTISAELSLEPFNLGAKLGIQLGFSVTASKSSTVSGDLDWTNPDPTQCWTVAKYQLIDDIAFVTPDVFGKVTANSPLAQYSGTYRVPGHDTKHYVSFLQTPGTIGETQFTVFQWSFPPS